LQEDCAILRLAVLDTHMEWSSARSDHFNRQLKTACRATTGACWAVELSNGSASCVLLMLEHTRIQAIQT
jgi:hypothetical protein